MDIEIVSGSMNTQYHQHPCTVIGNGPGSIPKLHGLVVCFNDIDIDHSSLVRVQSGHAHDLHRDFMVLQGDLLEGFSEQLKKSATKLEQQLGIWPSTGLATLEALTRLNIASVVYRMPLTPSFIRDDNCRDHIAKASSYHNWLGERRYAFTELGCVWDSLLLIKPEGATHMNFDPFELLLNGQITLADLSVLASISPDCLLEIATAERIESVEYMFYLKRDQPRSTNWWFFNREASEFIDLIFRKLAWCQQYIYR
jgi:hypothetical protein